MERVLDHFDARFCILDEDYLHDIEAEKNIGIVQHPQPSQAAAGNSFLFLSIDRFERPSEILAGPRFHFHENQGVVVAADDVDLAAAMAPKIAEKNFVAVTLQKSAR